MRDLKIECRGITDITFANGGNGSVELFQPDMSFLEDIDSSIIIKNHDNQKLLDAIDADEIAEWYSSKYDVTVIDHSRDVEQKDKR